MQKRCLSDLTIKNDFMFGAVMINPENCKEFLERALEIEIDRVDVSREKSMVYHPDYKGIRLDVYAKDENNTCYNVEMQMTKKPALGRRSRYYQSQMDMDILLSGREYAELPDSYVIFICDFDHFGERKYRYTFQMQCKESNQTPLEDGRRIVFLSTCGENEDEISKELLAFLKFVKADLKESREMEERFMTLEEMLKDERKEGLKEGTVKAQKRIVSKMLSKGLSDEEIMELCDISFEELENLKNHR